MDLLYYTSSTIYQSLGFGEVLSLTLDRRVNRLVSNIEVPAKEYMSKTFVCAKHSHPEKSDIMYCKRSYTGN